MRSFGLAAILAAVSLAACATRTYAVKQGDARVGAAMEQPFRDISIIREVAPETLVRAAEAPYRLRPEMSCEDLLLEVGALDAVLGADVDEPREEEKSEIDLVGAAAGAVGGVLGLPYRGIVRKVSGAEKREKALQNAILAGMMRRAFLKGVAHDRACSAPQ